MLARPVSDDRFRMDRFDPVQMRAHLGGWTGKVELESFDLRLNVFKCKLVVTWYYQYKCPWHILIFLILMRSSYQALHFPVNSWSQKSNQRPTTDSSTSQPLRSPMTIVWPCSLVSCNGPPLSKGNIVNFVLLLASHAHHLCSGHLIADHLIGRLIALVTLLLSVIHLIG